MRAAAVGLALAAAPLLAPACEAQGRAEASEAELRLELELRDASGRALRRPRRSAPITFVLTLHNPGDQPLRLSFASAQTHDVVVLRSDGEEVWRMSHGLFFAQVLTQIVLPPGGSQELPASWEVPEELEPGRYRARGLLTTRPTALEAAPVAFSLE